MREAWLLPLGARQPPSGEHAVLERPPPGLARGGIQASGGTVVAMALGLVLLTLGYYGLRLRKARHR